MYEKTLCLNNTEFFHLDSKFRAILIFIFVQLNSLYNASFFDRLIGNNLKTIISHFGEKTYAIYEKD